MIIQVVQHNGAHSVVATPQHRRTLIVQRRYRIWSVDWGGWTIFSEWHQRFPQGFELARSDLAAGNWADLRPRTIRIPFEKYLYWHEADGAGIEVVGPGFLLGAHMSIARANGKDRDERVYLVTTPDGHYVHSPNRERRSRLEPALPAKAIEGPPEPRHRPHEGPFEPFDPSKFDPMESFEWKGTRKGQARSNKSRVRSRLR